MTNETPIIDTYEAPEVIELGAAEQLTLGAVGCKADGMQCKFNEKQLEVF